ncbi:MAG: TlpA family protein disulfide reductase [Desulfurivibrio sp.]|nr:TlpA family protein disulfide reductase [Desulfurivibrio sp.]MBU4034568.1 TlpA family protein disulfide reductase [Pseudomonadota bacterium]MBU4117867.1 TlpA family protein disulfide reductase [Pseudomonadota bacterium]
MRKTHASKIIVSLALLLLATTIFSHPEPAWADKAPEFQLQSVNSTELIQSRNYQGKVMLVNFWATWCPPCRKEIPSLIELQKEYNGQGFTVIGISVDQAGVEVVKKFTDKLAINYPVVLGTSEVARGFGSIAGIPASFLIDRKGNIAKSYAGYVTHEELKKDIDAVIGL